MKDLKSSFSRALITGISGSGGSFLAEYISSSFPQVEVHGISRWHSAASNRNLESVIGSVKMHECDLCDFSSTFSVLKQVLPDVIFHIAAHANVRASFITPLSVTQNNILGTANLLEAVRLVGLDPVIQICSTSEVYGQVDKENVPITEECVFNPASPYAVSKITQDLLGLTYFKSYKMKIIRTRMFAYLNPRRHDLFATSFALQVARIEEGSQKTLYHGNLNSVRTLIDVKDAMSAYCTAGEKCEGGEAYNIGGNTVIEVGEFLNILKSKANCKIPTKQDKKLLRPADVTLQIPNVSKFVTRTGWKPIYSFEQSVDHLLAECRKYVQATK